MGSLEASLINFLQEDRDISRHEAYELARAYIALIIGTTTVEAQCRSVS